MKISTRHTPYYLYWFLSDLELEKGRSYHLVQIRVLKIESNTSAKYKQLFCANYLTVDSMKQLNVILL